MTYPLVSPNTSYSSNRAGESQALKPLSLTKSTSPTIKPFSPSYAQTATSTLKQKIAARANGAKSRGPVTEAGKEISSRNAVRHGMLSNSFLFDNEKHEFFDELVANLYEEHQPTTETERALIETMAVARWRQMRLWGMEKTMLTEEMTSNVRVAGPNAPLPTLPQCSAQAFRTLTENGRGLQLVMRYEAQSFRTFVRCLKTLTELQENTPKIEECETNPIVDFPEQNQSPADPNLQPEMTTPKPLRTPSPPLSVTNPMQFCKLQSYQQDPLLSVIRKSSSRRNQNDRKGCEDAGGQQLDL